MRNSVTTPGGFFIGVGGIVASLFVAFGVYWIVKKPTPNDDLQPQLIAQKLVPAEVTTTYTKAEADTVKREASALLDAAAAKYNGGKTPDVREIEDFRGVLRYREAQKTLAASAEIHLG